LEALYDVQTECYIPRSKRKDDLRLVGMPISLICFLGENKLIYCKILIARMNFW